MSHLKSWQLFTHITQYAYHHCTITVKLPNRSSIHIRFVLIEEEEEEEENKCIHNSSMNNASPTSFFLFNWNLFIYLENPITLCEVLRQQNDALRQELHDIRRVIKSYSSSSLFFFSFLEGYEIMLKKPKVSLYNDLLWFAFFSLLLSIGNGWNYRSISNWRCRRV